MNKRRITGVTIAIVFAILLVSLLYRVWMKSARKQTHYGTHDELMRTSNFYSDFWHKLI